MTQTKNRILGKRKDIQHASLSRVLRQVSHRTHKAERGGRVARGESTRNDRARPAADTREYRHVLLPGRPTITNRLPDDPRATLELPQQRTALRIDRLEPTVHRAVENNIARRHERAAPHRKVFRDGPNLF